MVYTHVCMWHSFFKALLFVILISFALPAIAAEELDYTDTLYFTWARVPLGELTITMKQSGDTYDMVAKGKTAGIALLFNKHESTTKVSGIMSRVSTEQGEARSGGLGRAPTNKNPTEQGEAALAVGVAGGELPLQNRPLPKLYSSDYVDNGDERLIAIGYDAQGFPVEEKIVPPREESRPLVPQEMKRGAVDILTGFFVMREKLKAALNKRNAPTEQSEARSGGQRSVGGVPPADFSVTIYDGKRLFRVDASIANPSVNVRFNNIMRPAIKLALQRVPLMGYKDKELKKMKGKNPVISLYVEPERMVPFGLSLPVYGAKLEAFIDPRRKKK